MKKRFLPLTLAIIMALGLVPTAMAAGPTFSDVPESHWAYEDVEVAAAKGLMNGTGGGAFSPDMKVSVAQFLTLVGRVVFPEVKAEGTDWAGPYVAEAQGTGLLDGTQVDVANPEAEISRYDMAVILRAAAKQLGVSEKLAQQGEVTDYGMVPTMYADAVLAVYGMGLIRGDQAGNFNGSNTMMRSEVVTVVVRLFKLKDASSQGGTTTVEPSHSPSVEPQPSEQPGPTEPQMVTALTWGTLWYYPTQGDASWAKRSTDVVGSGIPFKILYTEDGGQTSVLMGESKTTEITSFELEFSVDEKLLNNPDGQFYLSAQFEKDGQLFVTQDLRTDGRRALCPVRVFEKGHGSGGDIINLVPPDGQKWDFELSGKVPDRAYVIINEAGNIRIEEPSPAGFSVQFVYYPEPNIQNQVPTGNKIVLGQTVASKDGSFALPVSIDTLDMVKTENFRIEMQGTYNGIDFFSDETDDLRTLSDIKTERINAARTVHLTFIP